MDKPIYLALIAIIIINDRPSTMGHAATMGSPRFTSGGSNFILCIGSYLLINMVTSYYFKFRFNPWFAMMHGCGTVWWHVKKAVYPIYQTSRSTMIMIHQGVSSVLMLNIDLKQLSDLDPLDPSCLPSTSMVEPSTTMLKHRGFPGARAVKAR